jgi:hypothetical protein
VAPQADTAELWKQYETLKDLYKFYVSQVVDFHRFYLAIAGGLVAFALANGSGATVLVLLLPMVISTGGVITFWFGIRKSHELTTEIKAIAKRLSMLSAHTEVLQFLCFAFLLVHLLIAGALLWLLFELDPSLDLLRTTSTARR